MILSSDNFIDAVAELRLREIHPINVFTPTNQLDHDQLAFLKADAYYRLLFGGNQSGKSITAAYDLACYARGKHPYKKNLPKGDIEIWVISAEYITIRTGIYRHLQTFIPKWDILKEGPNVPNHLLPSYINVKRHIDCRIDPTIEVTAKITFMSAKGENREKFQAAAVHKIYIDEEIEEVLMEELEARTLVSGGDFTISATLAESYDWIVNLEERAEKGDPNVNLVRLNTEKNPHVNLERLKFLQSKWSLEAQEYRIKGKSKRSTGLIYKEFTKAHLVAPFRVPLNWPRWRCIDPGIRLCAVLWVAVSPDDIAYAYRELYFSNEPLYRIAEEIKTSEGWVLDRGLSEKYGHFVWNETENSEQILVSLVDDRKNSRLITGEEGVMDQLARKYGLLTVSPDKSLAAGIEDVRYWLQSKRIFIFDTLVNFQEEIKSYRIREKASRKNQNDPIDIPVKKHDHLMDCFRYIARENPRYSQRILAVATGDRNVSTNRTTSERIKQRKDDSYGYIEELVGSW